MIHPSAPADAAAVIDHYEELDRFYREIWGEHIHHGLWRSGHETPEEAAESLIDVIAELASIGTGASVCDIGSGYGATARLLAKRFGARVTAITLVQAQHDFAVAAREVENNPTFLLRDWMVNDLPSSTFDVALAIESTEHMPDKSRALAEARRILRPGGRLALCAWCASEAPTFLDKRYLLEPICKEGRLAGMASESEYTELLRSAGLAVDAILDLSRSVRATWSVCMRRVFQRLLTDKAYRSYLKNPESRNRVFVLTLARIWIAYRRGAMRYMVFLSHRPSNDAADLPTAIHP